MQTDGRRRDGRWANAGAHDDGHARGRSGGPGQEEAEKRGGDGCGTEHGGGSVL